jgi:hypothetical protein
LKRSILENRLVAELPSKSINKVDQRPPLLVRVWLSAHLDFVRVNAQDPRLFRQCRLDGERNVVFKNQPVVCSLQPRAASSR